MSSISRGLGLPPWTNHIAFDAPDLEPEAVRAEIDDGERGGIGGGLGRAREQAGHGIGYRWVRKAAWKD